MIKLVIAQLLLLTALMVQPLTHIGTITSVILVIAMLFILVCVLEAKDL